VDTSGDTPIPEMRAIVNARLVHHPESGNEFLLATTEGGEHVAFGFEVESAAPGLVLVDPRLWLEASEAEAPELSELRFDATEEAWADDWLPVLLAHPVAAEWLGGVKHAHPEAYGSWFAQEDYEEGGEG
jgi:hypothetical protein